MSRPGSRGRITAALVGLVVLVLAGWLIKEQAAEAPPPSPPVVKVDPGR